MKLIHLEYLFLLNEASNNCDFYSNLNFKTLPQIYFSHNRQYFELILNLIISKNDLLKMIRRELIEIGLY